MPTGVILIATPRSYRHADRIVGANIPLDTQGILSVDSRSLVLQDPAGNHYLHLPETDAASASAAVIPLDADAPTRLAALLRLYRRLIGRHSGPLPQAWRLTPRQRRRLVLMVRALDGHLSKASYREIAEALHGLEAVARYPWKTSSVRGQTIRLVRDAVIAMNGGYRNLLRGDR